MICLNPRTAASQTGINALRKKETNSSSPEGERDTWRKRLQAFHALPGSDDDAIINETIKTWTLLQRPSARLVALTVIIPPPLLNLLLFIVTRGAIFHSPWLLILGTLFPLSAVAQRAITYALNFRRVKQTVQSRVTYADVNERRLSDYRSALLRWLLALLVVINAFLLLVLPSLPGLTNLPIPTPSIWLRIVVFLGMLFIVLVGEMCQQRVVTLPRLVVAANPLAARHADDLLRTHVIYNIYKGIVHNLRNAILLQWFFLLPWLCSSPLLFTTQLVVTLLCLLCWLPLLWHYADVKLSLGGRKTGWPWQQRAMAS